MAGQRSASRTCHSAGKVTASLLLLFLAISSTSIAPTAAHSSDQQDDKPQIPILAPPLPVDTDHTADIQEDALQFVSVQQRSGGGSLSGRQPCANDDEPTRH